MQKGRASRIFERNWEGLGGERKSWEELGGVGSGKEELGGVGRSWRSQEVEGRTVVTNTSLSPTQDTAVLLETANVQSSAVVHLNPKDKLHAHSPHCMQLIAGVLTVHTYCMQLIAGVLTVHTYCMQLIAGVLTVHTYCEWFQCISCHYWQGSCPQEVDTNV